MIPAPFGWLRGPGAGYPDWCELRPVRAEPGSPRAQLRPRRLPPAHRGKRYWSPSNQLPDPGHALDASCPPRRGASPGFPRPGSCQSTPVPRLGQHPI